jgi:hypothetical protein
VRRVVALTAGLAVTLTALLTGCGSGPSQVGAAAIVGDKVISIRYVQDWWDRYVATPQIKEELRQGSNFDDLGRVIVTQSVRHELLAQAAQREHLSFDEAQVTKLIEDLGGEQAAVEATNSIYDKNTIRDRARDQLLAVALGHKYFESTSVLYDYTLAPSREQAQAKVRELAAAGAERARELIKADDRRGLRVGLDVRQHIADSVDYAVNTPLFAVPAGNVLAYPDPDQANQGQWVVVVLRERRTDDFSSTGNVDQVNESRLEGVGLRLLGPLSRDIGVRVNPRYGFWSDAYVAVGPSEGEIPAIVKPLAQPASS